MTILSLKATCHHPEFTGSRFPDLRDGAKSRFQANWNCERQQDGQPGSGKTINQATDTATWRACLKQRRHKLKEKTKKMKKVFTSALLTVTAVPFLVAAPAANKPQDQSATQTQTTTKKVKKHKKAKNGKGTTESGSTESK